MRVVSTRTAMRRLVLSPKARTMALGGIAWIVIGLGFVSVPVERFSRPGPGGPLQFLDDWPIFAILWIVGGSIAVVMSFLRRKLPARADQIGFLSLATPSFVWSASYFWSYYLHIITSGGIGRADSWRPGVVYMVAVGLLLTIADLLDPTDRVQPGPTIEEDHGGVDYHAPPGAAGPVEPPATAERIDDRYSA